MKLTHKVVNTECRQWRPSMWIIYIVEGEFKTNSIAAAVFKQQKHSHQTFWECGRITLKFIWRILLKEPMKSLKKKNKTKMESGCLRFHILEFTFFFLLYFSFLFYFVSFYKPGIDDWLAIEFSSELYSVNTIGEMGSCLGRKLSFLTYTEA